MGEGDLDFDWGALFSGNESPDLSSLMSDTSGLADMGLTGVGDLPELDFSKMDLSGLDNADLSQLGELGLTGVDLDNLLKTEGGAEALSRSLASTDKDTSGGTGLRSTGRGQMSLVDELTGATGITGEGFNSLKDLLGSGTAEEIARYTPGTADYSLKSGLETSDGQGLSADSTRGMGLAQMGGAQGLSKYIPAEYSESALTDLVKNNPGAFPEIEKYLDSQYDKAGLTPFKGTGGTLSETGFLSQSSAANPLGSKYSLGDPRSFINNPTITGQQSVVSPGRTIIDNKDGTYKVVTNTVDGTKTITTTKEGVDKIINNTKTDTKTNPGAAAKAADKKDNSNMLLALLALMAMMNKGGGSSGSSAVIPSLTADRKQLPYGPASGSTARPGAGGVTYFSPTTYTQKAAGGGLMSLAGGGQLSPEELTQQLQAYKASAPTTQEDFAKQQSLWNDYADRYANSSWNYANMGGKPQDYSLKPADYLQKQVTGYADPINQFMSQTQQNTPTYSLMQDILTNKPEVNEAFKTVLAAKPDAFKNDPSVTEATIRNLSADLNQFGTDTALKHFYQDQQNLVGLGSNNREQSQTMDNPQYAALQKQIMEKTARVSDPAWNAMSKKGIGQNDITSFWRDPVSGLGIGSDASGQTLMYFDRDGRPLSSSVIGDLGKNARKYGIDLSSLGASTKKAAGGGMMYGGGGISDLGGYSDGGRLLRGPGDGVSDSIPATIGGKQPARLAEGEFVVPARIVSELGNGSTDAGAQKLYAMMDRVQNARRKTKNVAADTKAHKYLPA